MLPNHVHFGPGPTCTYFYDPASGERRKAQRGDAGATSRVCDALDNISFVMSLSYFDDVRPMLSPVYEFAEMIYNTGKPVFTWATNPETLSDIHQIAAAIAGSEEALRKRPLYTLFSTYKSPLRLSQYPLANMLWAAERGIPIICLGGPTVALESPITAASGLVLYLAASLSALAIVQIKQSGAPVIIGAVPAAMDLHTARPAYGSPELCINSAAAAELAHFFRNPLYGYRRCV